MRKLLILLTLLLSSFLSQAQWVEWDEILASDGASSDYFGWSTGISGDWAIVGSPQDDDNGGNSGSVRFHTYLNLNGWALSVKKNASDGNNGDEFGKSVAIDGGWAIVGAFRDDDNGGGSGSAYFFELQANGLQWEETDKVIASNGNGGDEFGWSVDINGTQAIVGAWNHNPGGASAAGAAYIFEYNGAAWVETAYLLASDGSNVDAFGTRVAITQDRAVVGAPTDDDDGSLSGSCYVFEKIGGIWQEVHKLTASDADAGDRFGHAVDVDEDYLVVGAPFNNDDGGDSGSAYIFEYNGSNWIQEPKITASDGDNDDQFGHSVGISGDQVVIGAHLNDDLGGNSGSAYIFLRSAGNWTENVKVSGSDGSGGDFMGFSVDISGTVAIAGAYSHDDNGGNSGSAYIIYDPIPGCTITTACNYDPGAYVDDGSCIMPDGCTDPAACNYDVTALCDDGSCSVPPSNDECVDAIEIIPNSGFVNTDNTNSCVDGPWPGCGAVAITIKDVWFSFVHTGGDVAIVADNLVLWDTRVALYDACGGSPLFCADPVGPATLNVDWDQLTIGTTYYIQAGGHEDLFGEFRVLVNTTEIPGCTDVLACNYQPSANLDDGSCLYDDACGVCGGAGTVAGCLDPAACNYNALADCDDGLCDYLDFDGDGDCDATDPDDDNDGLDDVDEAIAGSDPLNADTDGDGRNDGEEVLTFFTDPLEDDSDSDGLTDGLEVNISLTDPNDTDTNDNGCTDDLEFGGLCGGSPSCVGDLNADGTINTVDLLAFLGVFGTDCPE